MTTIGIDELKRGMTQALRRRGLSEEHAAWVVDGLIEASLRGVDTHGVRLLPTYLDELDGGRCRARPELLFTSGSTASRLLDAGHALGPVAAMTAAREAVRLAREHGVGAVAVRRSNYFGASSQYTLEIARHGMIGLSFTNSDALVAPIGGARPMFGTNPLSFAAPGEGDDMFCVDMATSQASFTRVKQHRDAGLPLEKGWAVGPDGQDASEEGTGEVTALLPLGGHKGQCLAMMVEVLCCLLADMPYDHELTHLYDEPFDEPRRTSHFFLALNIASFQPPEKFRWRLSHLMRLIRAEGEATGRQVIVPGDLEAKAWRQRQSCGLSVPDNLLARIQ